MELIKFKKIGKNKYKVSLEDTEITIYEDIIFKYDLLIKKSIDIETLDKIIDDNKYYEAYYLALNYIDIKMRNKKEIIKYLKGKEIDNIYIDFALDKIDALGLLNDKKYIEAFINDKINLSIDGPFKIKRCLIEYDFNESDIDEYLNKICNSVWEDKIKKIVTKKTLTNKNKSYFILINKLSNDLYNLGYDKSMIELELSNIKYDNSSINKEAEKAYKKYKKDKNKIVNYLLRKGYTYEEVNSCLQDYENNL